MPTRRQVRYIGNSAFEIVSRAGTRVLIDPYITGNMTCKLKLEDIPAPDLVLVTHGARDHMGDTLEICKRSQCTVISEPAVIQHLRKNGIPNERLRSAVWGFVIDFKDVSARVVQSQHISRFESGGEMLTGMSLGFIVRTGNDPAFYHPGDTSIFSDIRLFGELYRPQIGLLPVGNAMPTVGTELWPREAALVCKWMHLKAAVPTHYCTDDKPREFKRWAKVESPDTRVIVMKSGDVVNL